MFGCIYLGSPLLAAHDHSVPLRQNAVLWQTYTECSWQPAWKQCLQNLLRLCLSLLGVFVLGVEFAGQVNDGIIPVPSNRYLLLYGFATLEAAFYITCTDGLD